MKLKPCPFCGGMAKIHNYRDYRNYYTVECCDCGIFVSDNYSREEDAVKGWNIRPAETELLETLKEIASNEPSSYWNGEEGFSEDYTQCSEAIKKAKQLIEKYEV